MAQGYRIKSETSSKITFASAEKIFPALREELAIGAGARRGYSRGRRLGGTIDREALYALCGSAYKGIYALPIGHGARLDVW
jgi:hypothetical protein